MSVWKPLRELYIKTTDITHGYQDDSSRIEKLYKFWAWLYDFSVKIDPAYTRLFRKMIDMTVHPGDSVLEVGSGTGIGTLYASSRVKSITALDSSPEMMKKLKKKAGKKKSGNIRFLEGRYPEAAEGRFNSVISSFTFVHFPPSERPAVYRHVYDNLLPGGRLGLFSARGEIAAAFETAEEILDNCRKSGFVNINIYDLSDIYRIATAERP